MYNAAIHKDKRKLKVMNFTHLMSIYESNYHNFRSLLKRLNSNTQNFTDHSSISIEDIHHDQYTRIFRIFHTFKYQNRQTLNTFSLKPHLIFYMYNDAKLLEVKSLQDNKRFECSIQGKIKLNLNLFYWLKSYINQ